MGAAIMTNQNTTKPFTITIAENSKEKLALTAEWDLFGPERPANLICSAKSMLIRFRFYRVYSLNYGEIGSTDKKYKC